MLVNLNKTEFKHLFDIHFDGVRNFIYYRCGDQELATDLAQDVFMRVWEKRLIPESGKEKALLFKIAGNLFVSRYRRMQLDIKFQSQNLHLNHELTPQDQIQYKELKHQYEKALSEMNEKQRLAFLMSRNDGLSYKEIADALQISVKAVEKRMSKALLYMKTKLQN